MTLAHLVPALAIVAAATLLLIAVLAITHRRVPHRTFYLSDSTVDRLIRQRDRDRDPRVDDGTDVWTGGDPDHPADPYL